MEMGEEEIPKHLRHWPGLFEWRDKLIVEAPLPDIEAAKNYPRYLSKGAVDSGRRLTIMSRRLNYKNGEEVRIIHVVEFVEPGHEVYIVGPKPVFGEYLDSVLVTAPPPGDLWAPATYNGAVLQSPAVDYNYEITSYHFDLPGRHSLQWRLGMLRSNILTFEITP
jgi:hypothetical protein